MKNKGFIYSFLLFCLFLLLGGASTDTEFLSLEDWSTDPVNECTVSESTSSGFSYTGDSSHLPVSMVFDDRKAGDKCQIKSLSKFIKLRDLYTLRPVSRFVARSYSLHNLFIPHNSSLSQLQTFII